MNAIDYFMITYVILAVVLVIIWPFAEFWKILIKHTWKPAVLLIVFALIFINWISQYVVGFETTLKYVEQNYGLTTARTLYGFNAIFSEVVAFLFIFQLADILFPLKNKNEEKRAEEQSTIEPPQTDHRKGKKIYLELEKVEEKEEV